MNSNSRHGSITGPKPTKACVNCRRQKMKCEVVGVGDGSSSCKRCRQAQIPCIFKPRANAAVTHDVFSPTRTQVAVQEPGASQQGLDPRTIISRLQTIESLLGIEPSSSETVVEDDVGLRVLDTESPFHGVFTAAAHLRSITRPAQNTRIWSCAVIKQLWLSFHKNMPGLHFLSKKKTSSTPTPLLLGAILYLSALHHQLPEFAILAPGYFVAACSSISELTIPIQAATKAGQRCTSDSLSEEQQAFQNVLGLILISLISEAFIETVGLWISMGYRLTLDYCPTSAIQSTSGEWRGLFSGLQIIDLEHASLHMSCPLVPKEAPLHSLRQLQTSAIDPFYSLTQMMHIGLSHFTGRGLPTIWSFISSNQVQGTSTAYDFTVADGKVMRDWARQLDEWLVMWNKPNDSDHDSLMIFRQYSLHRLFVLSIYHPARGFDLFANNVAAVERHELLVSARATLKLQSEDKGIWSNWDLVMITWAALLVLQGVEGGVGDPDDFILIQSHLNMLQLTHQPPPSLRHTLATRLESALQNMNTPRPAPEPEPLPNVFDPSWLLFDQNSMMTFGEGIGDSNRTSSHGTSEVATSTGNPSSMVVFSAGNGNADPRMEPRVSQNYQDRVQEDESGQWLSNEQYTDAWQNTLFRLFGNSEMSTNENEFGI